MTRRLIPILLLAAGLAGCDRSGGDDAAAATTAPARSAGGPPVLAFDTVLHDFGPVDETTTVDAAFEFTNAGGSELIIERVKVSCGCTTTELDRRRYRPGERGRIQVSFDPTRPGSTRKFVTVHANTTPPVQRLTIAADVTPFLVVEPRILQLGVVEYGTQRRATLTITSTDEDFVIDSINPTVEHVSARVVPEGHATRPGPKTVEVTVAPTAEWGALYFGLDVTATGRPSPGAEPVTHTRQVRVAGRVFGELSAEPDMFRFSVVRGDPVASEIRLTRSGGRPFRILGADVQIPALPGATVRAEPQSLDRWTITLTATADTAFSSAPGKVVVTTDVPGEQIIELRSLGVIRAPE